MATSPIPVQTQAAESMPEETVLPELTEDDQADILALVRLCAKEEQYSRRQEVRWARQQRFYERGDQNIGYDSRTYSFLPLADFAKENNQTLPKYTQVYNIYRPRLRSLVSVLSQVTPGVNFQPNSLKNSNDISAAQFGEKLRHKLYRDVDLKAIQTEVARMFCTDARAVLWTRDDGTVWVGGVLESKVPIHLKDSKQWGYCSLSWEEDIYRCKDEFPDVADKIQPSESTTAEGTYERIARLGVLGGTRSLTNGENSSQHLTTRSEVFIDPARYRKLTKEVQPKVQQMFPFGMRVTVCGGAFCAAQPDSMWEQKQDGALIHPGSISVRYASAGDGANRPSLLKDMVPLQDSFNDTMNLRREAIDYGIPATWYDSDAVDDEAIANQASQPGAMHGVKVPSGSNVSNLVFQEQAAAVPPDAGAMTDMMTGEFADSVSGDLPSLNGGQIPSSDTVGVYSMSREQALGGLSVAWASVQGIIASMTYQGVIKMAQRMGDSEVTIEDDSGAESFNASEVLRGGFQCYPDQDSSFPETTASKRAALMQAMQTFGATPQGQTLMEQPENARFFLQTSGLEDIVIPDADADQRQLEEIEQLLNEPPVPQTDPATGAPVMGDDGQPVMQSSVPIDEVYDLHAAHFAKVQNWMQSSAKTQQIRKGNIEGVMNVSLHGKLHKAILDKQAADAAAAANQQKPPALSVAYKDVEDPNAKAQILAEAGIKTSAGTIQEEQGAAAAQDALPHILAHQKAAKQDFGDKPPIQ